MKIEFIAKYNERDEEVKLVFQDSFDDNDLESIEEKFKSFLYAIGFTWIGPDYHLLEVGDAEKEFEKFPS